MPKKYPWEKHQPKRTHDGLLSSSMTLLRGSGNEEGQWFCFSVGVLSTARFWALSGNPLFTAM